MNLADLSPYAEKNGMWGEKQAKSRLPMKEKMHLWEEQCEMRSCHGCIFYVYG